MKLLRYFSVILLFTIMLMVVACSEEIENNTEDPKIDIPENPSENRKLALKNQFLNMKNFSEKQPT